MMFARSGLMRAAGSPAVLRSAVVSATTASDSIHSVTGGSGSKHSFATAPNPSLDLKSILAKKIVEHQKRVKEFRSVYGSKGLGEVTVEQASLSSSSSSLSSPFDLTRILLHGQHTGVRRHEGDQSSGDRDLVLGPRGRDPIQVSRSQQSVRCTRS